MKILKRFLAVLICIAMLFSFASCSTKGKTVINVSGAEIDYETFLYFLDTVKSSPVKYGLSEKPDAKQIKQAAIEQCKQYVAVNTWLKEEKLSLSQNEKSAAADKLNNTWRIFSHYYEELGISKQILMKIMLGEANRNRLFYYIFDEGGENAVAEKDIKAFYENNYITFRAINVYLSKYDSNGKAVALNDKERKAAIAELEDLNQKLIDGMSTKDIAELYQTKHPGTSVSDQLLFIKKDANSYPDGFFDKVKALKTGTSDVLVSEEYAFLVLHEDINAEDAQQYYSLYRDDCLKSLKGEEFDALVKEYADKFKVDVNDKLVNKAMEAVGINVK